MNILDLFYSGDFYTKNPFCKGTGVFKIFDMFGANRGQLNQRKSLIAYAEIMQKNIFFF